MPGLLVQGDPQHGVGPGVDVSGLDAEDVDRGRLALPIDFKGDALPALGVHEREGAVYLPAPSSRAETSSAIGRSPSNFTATASGSAPGGGGSRRQRGQPADRRPRR